MTRYYYTDVLAAAWMTKHFGMKLTYGYWDADFLGYGIGLIEDCADIEDFLCLVGKGEKFYIHPDSLHLLKPTAGDFCIASRLGFPDHAIYILESDDFREDVSIKIIQRNYIPFMRPESDEA